MGHRDLSQPARATTAPQRCFTSRESDQHRARSGGAISHALRDVSPNHGNTHVPTMRQPRSSEEWLAAVDDIIRRYRTHSVELGRKAPLTQEEAIAALRRLGLTTGDALRWLSEAARRPVS
jgi:hypothetical protein